MQIEPDKIEFLYPAAMALDGMPSLGALPPFADEICRFLGAFSRESCPTDEAGLSGRDYAGLLVPPGKHRAAEGKLPAADCQSPGPRRHFPYRPLQCAHQFRLFPRMRSAPGGKCLHCAGPQQAFPPDGIVCRAIRQVFESDAFNTLENHIAVVRYERDQDITAYFFFPGAMFRIILGGDDTIREIRTIPIPPRFRPDVCRSLLALCHPGGCVSCKIRPRQDGRISTTTRICTTRTPARLPA